MQGDGSVLEEVHKLGVLVALCEDVVRARITIQDHLAGIAWADEPVEMSLHWEPSLAGQRDHLKIAKALTLRFARAHLINGLSEEGFALVVRRRLGEWIACKLELWTHELDKDFVHQIDVAIGAEHEGAQRRVVKQLCLLRRELERRHGTAE